MFPWKNTHVPNNEGAKNRMDIRCFFWSNCSMQDFYKSRGFSPLLLPSPLQMTEKRPLQSFQAEVQVPGFLHQRSLGFFQRGKALVSTNCKGRNSGEFTVGKKRRNLPREYDVLYEDCNLEVIGLPKK